MCALNFLNRIMLVLLGRALKFSPHQQFADFLSGDLGSVAGQVHGVEGSAHAASQFTQELDNLGGAGGGRRRGCLVPFGAERLSVAGPADCDL